jgi:hypothetical protein
LAAAAAGRQTDRHRELEREGGRKEEEVKGDEETVE